MLHGDSEIGRRIYDLRVEHDVQQGELAKAIHLHQSVLNRIEKGTRPARDNEIRAIALFFHVSADELLGLDDQDGDPPSHSGKEMGDLLCKPPILHPCTSEERELLKKYLQLDERGKATVHDVICSEWRFVMHEG